MSINKRGWLPKPENMEGAVGSHILHIAGKLLAQDECNPSYGSKAIGLSFPNSITICVGVTTNVF